MEDLDLVQQCTTEIQILVKTLRLCHKIIPEYLHRKYLYSIFDQLIK